MTYTFCFVTVSPTKAVIVELSPDSVDVLETVGEVEFCVNVTVPGPMESLPYTIGIIFETRNGSAGKYI